VNARLKGDEFPKAPDFHLPYNGGEYVQDQNGKGLGRIQAKEHRNVMQVLPHILADIDRDLCELAAR